MYGWGRGSEIFSVYVRRVKDLLGLSPLGLISRFLRGLVSLACKSSKPLYKERRCSNLKSSKRLKGNPFSLASRGQSPAAGVPSTQNPSLLSHSHSRLLVNSTRDTVARVLFTPSAAAPSIPSSHITSGIRALRFPRILCCHGVFFGIRCDDARTVDSGDPRVLVFCCRDPIISRHAAVAAAAAAGVTGFPARDAWLQDDDVFVPGRASICPGSHPEAMDAAPSIDYVLCSSIDDGAGAHDGKHPGGHDDSCSTTLHQCCCPPRCTNHPAPIHRWDLL